jgi:hypothetical protein
LGEHPSGEGVPHRLATSIRGVYTFGQPRVGDWQFASKYEDHLGTKTFRFVNNNDVVARVPPAVLGFRHVGRMLLFDHTGALTERDNPADLVGQRHAEAFQLKRTDETTVFLKSGASLFDGETDAFKPVSDHFLKEGYIEKLEKNESFIPEPLEAITWRQVWLKELMDLGLIEGRPPAKDGNGNSRVAPTRLDMGQGANESAQSDGAPKRIISYPSSTTSQLSPAEDTSVAG